MSKCEAIPWCRKLAGTNSRGIPRGVGSGAGSQNSDEELTETSDTGGSLLLSLVGEGSVLGAETTAIAVEIRSATTHPAIFSLEPFGVVGGIKNKYTFEARNVAQVRGGADRVKLIVSRRVAS